MIGQTISHYTILDRLGGGGMGVVYKAEDTRLKRTVALKFLPPEVTFDLEAKARFIHEAQAASALQHDNICTIHDIDETPDGRLFICMDYYEGETLKKTIERGPLALDQAVGITTQIARGLSCAHAAGMIHRDIKPANIMLTQRGDVKIVDFGLAMLVGQTRLTKEGTTLGTVAYMSPEQLRGEEVDRRADLWSLGVLLHEMLAGRLPFKGDFEQAVVYSILQEQPEPITSVRTGIPPELEHLISKALSKSPAERYQHADEIIADLTRLQHQSDSIRPAVQTVAAPTGRKPRRLRTILAAGLAIAAVAAAAYLLPRFLAREPHPTGMIPIAVTSFENQTGDPKYDYLMKSIPNLLITSLEQSDFLRVTTWERMRDLLRQTGKADPQEIDRDLGFTLCKMDGVGALVVGSFTKAGDQFATDVKVLDVESKEIIAGARSQGEGEASILRTQIDRLSEEIAQGIGLAGLKRETAARPIAEITTRSLDAYTYFLLGREKQENFHTLDAVRYLTKAVEIDTTFGMAFLYLGQARGEVGDLAVRDSMYTRAYRLSPNVSEKERMYILAKYEGIVQHDRAAQIRIMETIRDRYPNEKQVHYDLGVLYGNQRLTDQAMASLEQALRLDPRYGPALNQMGYSQMTAGRFREALSYLARYAAVIPSEPNPYDSMGDCYFSMGNVDSAFAMYEEAVRREPQFVSCFKIAYIHALREQYDQAFAWSERVLPSGGTGGPGLLCYWKGMLHHLIGRRTQAHREADSARTMLRRQGSRFFLAAGAMPRALMLMEEGKAGAAREAIESSLAMSRALPPAEARWFTLPSAVVLSRYYLSIQRLDSARAWLAQAIGHAREETNQSNESSMHELLLLRGEMLLSENDPDSAIALLTARPPLGPPAETPVSLQRYSFVCLYTPFRDVLARAYRKKGDLAGAVREYERLTTLSLRGTDLRLINPKHHYRLAQVYEESGESAKAAEAYRTFLRIWEDADGTPPEVKDARARLRQLEGRARP